MRIISLFSGCGGLDLGFANAGFKIVYANDNDKAVWETYDKNHNLAIDKRSIVDIKSDKIPKADGIVGGPPCQSWSLAGAMRGGSDQRGMLFYDYIRVLKDKEPLFFVAENVPGIVSKTHLPEFIKIIHEFENLGYVVNYKLLDSRDYGVPQERKRVIIVGYHKKLGKKFEFPQKTHSENEEINVFGEKTKKWITLEDAIGNLSDATPGKDKNHTNTDLTISNHEFMNGGFSSMYMSRNRRRCWDQQSFTIQAGGRHAPLHPGSSKMLKVEKDLWTFEGDDPKYRRLSVRECARVQTFPDNFIFYYKRIADGYKMVGNAVPVKLAEVIARKIKDDLQY